MTTGEQDGELWFLEKQWSGEVIVWTRPQNLMGVPVDIEVHTPIAVRVVARGRDAEALVLDADAR